MDLQLNQYVHIDRVGPDKYGSSSDTAMTGEITLHGQYESGGLKEKLLAAHRGRIKCYYSEELWGLGKVPQNITQDLTIHPVSWIDEVYRSLWYQNETINCS